MSSIDLIPDPSSASDQDSEPWLDVSRDVATALRADAVERDQANAQPLAEAELLRSNGLLALTIAREYGGEGAPWRLGLQAARLIARSDASIAQILAYHYGWLRLIDALATDEARQVLRESAARQWLWASPGMSRLGLPSLIPHGDGYFLDGAQTFATGGPVADRLLARAAHAETGELCWVVADPAQPQVRFTGEWDTLGQRLSASRGIVLSQLPTSPADVVGTYGPLDKPFPPHHTLSNLNFQLALAAVQLGIAEGALLEASEYTREHTRAWHHSIVEEGREEPFILQRYGSYVADLQAVAALVEKAERVLSWLYSLGVSVTAAQRAAGAEIIASTKVRSTEAGLALTSGLFDLTGARSTARSFALDRFWRNLRTLSLHDPMAYKEYEIGQFFVNGRYPEPSGYR
jgi:alkylation response protein AidB-like acyl-CoA dehydrogenase